MIGASAGLWWYERELSEANTSLKNSIDNITKEIGNIEDAASVSEKNKASEGFRKAKKYRVKWSVLVAEIFETENKNIKFLNFSANPEGKITVSGIAARLEDLKTLLRTIKSNPRLGDPFIHSLAEVQGTSAVSDLLGASSNQTLTQFELTFKYLENLSS
jgi:hypothetical protein